MVCRGFRPPPGYNADLEVALHKYIRWRPPSASRGDPSASPGQAEPTDGICEGEDSEQTTTTTPTVSVPTGSVGFRIPPPTTSRPSQQQQRRGHLGAAAAAGDGQKRDADGCLVIDLTPARPPRIQLPIFGSEPSNPRSPPLPAMVQVSERHPVPFSVCGREAILDSEQSYPLSYRIPENAALGPPASVSEAGEWSPQRRAEFASRVFIESYRRLRESSDPSQATAGYEYVKPTAPITPPYQHYLELRRTGQLNADS